MNSDKQATSKSPQAVVHTSMSTSPPPETHSAQAGPSNPGHQQVSSSPEPFYSALPASANPDMHSAVPQVTNVFAPEPRAMHTITFAAPAHPPPAQLFESRRSSLGTTMPPPPPRPILWSPSIPLQHMTPSPTRRSFHSPSPHYSSDSHQHGNGNSNEHGLYSHPTSIQIHAPPPEREEHFPNANLSPVALNMVGPYPSTDALHLRPRPERVRSMNVSSVYPGPRLYDPPRRSSTGGVPEAAMSMGGIMPGTFEPLNEVEDVGSHRSAVGSVHTGSTVSKTNLHLFYLFLSFL